MNVGFRYFNGKTDWGWVNQQVPILRVEDTGGYVAYNEDTDELLGACIWDNLTQTTIQCHFMLTDKVVLRHGFLPKIFDIIFNHAGLSTIYGLVPSNRPKAVRLNKHMGFTVKTVLDNGFADGIHYLLMELKKEDCKYLEPLKMVRGNHGQEV